MKDIDITKIRQLLKQVLTFEGKCTSFHPDSRAATQTYKWILEKIYNRIKEALALLPCETCNGTGFVQAECEACAIGVSHSASECGGGKPCPTAKRNLRIQKMKSKKRY